MKSVFCIAFLLSLSGCITHAMQEQPIIMEATTPPPDLMPSEARAIIKILNNPDKYEQPDHISIIGKPGSGKTTICKRIIAEINASPMFCDGYDLIESYSSCTDEKTIRESIKNHLIAPSIQEALQNQRSRAVLVIQRFELLYCNQSQRHINYILKGLNPSNYADLKPPLLIINESEPLKNPSKLPPVKGANIIHIAPPDLTTRKQFIRYLVAQHNYACNEETQEAMAQTTHGKSLSAIAGFLAHQCHINRINDEDDQECKTSRCNAPKGKAPLEAPAQQDAGNEITTTTSPASSLSKAEFERQRLKEKMERLKETTKLVPPRPEGLDEPSTPCCAIV